MVHMLARNEFPKPSGKSVQCPAMGENDWHSPRPGDEDQNGTPKEKCCAPGTKPLAMRPALPTEVNEVGMILPQIEVTEEAFDYTKSPPHSPRRDKSS